MRPIMRYVPCRIHISPVRYIMRRVSMADPHFIHRVLLSTGF